MYYSGEFVLYQPGSCRTSFQPLTFCILILDRTALWWDTATPYHNVRIEPKEDYDVLIVAGGDHNTGMRPEDFRDTYGILETWARARWTSAGEVVCKWTGQASLRRFPSCFEPVKTRGSRSEKFKETVQRYRDLHFASYFDKSVG